MKSEGRSVVWGVMGDGEGMRVRGGVLLVG